MKRIAIAALTALISTAALAADLPVKANRFLTYPTGCGVFYGVNSMGSGGGVNGSVVSGPQVVTGDIGATLGYGCPLGATPGSFWFVDAMFDVSRSSSGPATSGIALGTSATFEQRAAIGAPWQQVAAFASLFPALNGVAVPSIQVLPNGVHAGAANPYAFVSLHEKDVSAQALTAAGKSWLVSWGAGIGALTRLSNGMVLDTWVEYEAASSGLHLGAGAANVRTGDAVRVGAALKL